MATIGGVTNLISTTAQREESAFLWARQMGCEGERLHRPSRTIESVEDFSYLDGDVVHFKVTNEGHGATHGISEQLLLDFFDAAPDGTPGAAR